MKIDREKNYYRMPYFVAKLYESFTSGKKSKIRHTQMLENINIKKEYLNLLEIGFGPGDTLVEIKKNNSNLNLYGIDISKTMLKIAEKKLGKNTNLIHGTIQQTDFINNFFDIILCCGSLYVWNNPVKCLNEIYRILKKNQSVYFFEIYKDFNKDIVTNEFKILNTEHNLLLKLFSPIFFRMPLKKTYKIKTFTEILDESLFKDNYKIEKVKMGYLSVWLKITAEKK